MKLGRLAVVGSLAAVSACSLLLDTDALQKGGATSATGTAGSAGSTASAGGTGGDGGASGSGGSGGTTGDDGGMADAATDGGKSCESDTDCLPGVEFDGCTLYACGPDKTCQAPRPNAGALALASAGTLENVLTGQDIGYPSLLADGNDIVLAVWHRTGAATDVHVRKYPPYPQGGAGAELSALAPGMFRMYGSSPGMITRGLVPRKVRLLLAAEPLGDAGAGARMRLVDIDVPTTNNNLRLSLMQPIPADLGVAGYDTRPRSFPPKLLPNGLQEPVGMWIQQQKLFIFDGTSATEAFATKRVLGFAPLGGSGLHAALLTSDLGAPNGAERAELWSQGSAALVSLDGDQLAPRRGLTSTFTNEAGVVANLVGWSFDTRAGVPISNYTAALCMAQSCTSVAVSGQGQSSIPSAMYPELASARVAGSMIDRDVVQSFEVSFPDPNQATLTGTALFAGVSRFTFPSADLSKSTTRPIYPPVFPVDAVSASAALPPGEALGPSSVAITGDGQILVAWVVRTSTNLAILRARRYTVKTCP